MITKTKPFGLRTFSLVFDDAFDTVDGQVEIDCQHHVEDFEKLNSVLHCNCGEDHVIDLRVCTICRGFWLDVTDLGEMPERFHGDMTPRKRGTGQ